MQRYSRHQLRQATDAPPQLGRPIAEQVRAPDLPFYAKGPTFDLS
jgi:hypothetical protein